MDNPLRHEHIEIPRPQREGLRRDYLYPVDPSRLRPYGDLVMVRCEWDAWIKSKGGILHPPLKDQRVRNVDGMYEKNEFMRVTVLAVGPKVRGVKPGQKVIAAAHSAVGGYLFNQVDPGKWGATPGRCDFFVHESLLRWEQFKAEDGELLEARREAGLVATVEE